MSAGLKKAFCVFPFTQAVVRTNGSLGPCCRMQLPQNIKQTSIETFWLSPGLQQLRSTMLQGEYAPECSTCYDEESMTGKSMRTGALKDYKFYNEKHYLSLLEHYKFKDSAFPNRLEIHLSNLCNLKCLTCSPQDSSSFLTEDRVLGITDLNQKDFQLSDESINHIMASAIQHDIDILDLRGGESMLVPVIKNILLDWPKEKLDNMTLRIQTNCTILDDDWKIIFKKFKKLDIMMSLDAIGEANEYIRFPSKWEDIKKNIAYITSLSNAKTYINCTVSNLNFLLLAPLIDWCRENNIFFQWSLVRSPKHFQFTNLPEELFLQAQDRLKDYKEVKGLMSYKSNTTLWGEFCNIIDLRDQHRKNRIFNIVPEYEKFWKSNKADRS